MGLDQYLKANLYVSKYSNEKFTNKIDKIRKMFPEMFKLGNLDTVEISFEVAYWKKANQIHKWFVDNVQDGKDECQTSCVGIANLKELIKLCEKVLKNKKQAKDILPTGEGFFFGSDDYDKWYFKDIENTIGMLTRALELPECWEFEYRASW